MMDRELFNKMWSRCHAIWGVTAPSDMRRSLCYEKVDFIPDEAVRWISEKLEELDSKPRNASKKIISLWYDWVENNPEKIVRPHTCKICQSAGHPGPGWIMALRPPMKNGELWQESILPCGGCKDNGVSPKQLIISGWKYLPTGIVPREFLPLLGIKTYSQQ